MLRCIHLWCNTAASTTGAFSLARRDYTNPYLPVAPFATDPGMLGLGIQAPINANPQEGNVLLAQVCKWFGTSTSSSGVVCS